MAGPQSSGAERRFESARGVAIRVACDRTNDLAQIQAQVPGLAISLDMPCHDLSRLNDYVSRVIEESAR